MLRDYFKNFDWWLALAAFSLTSLGILMLFGMKQFGGEDIVFKKQLFFLLLGIILMFLVSLFDYRRIKANSSFVFSIYFFAVISLAAVFVFGSEIRGSTSWFKIGLFSVEPVEFVKIITLVLLAKFFTLRHAEIYRISHIVLSAVYIAIPIGLVLLQPDFGSAMLLLLIWFGMMIVAGIKKNHLLLLVLLAIVSFTVMWMGFFKDYQKERLLTFMDPLRDPRGSGYNIIQAKIAIGSGGLWGSGLGQGTQTQLGFLPEAHTDFIFAAIAEEFGFVGILFVFAGYTFLSWRIIKIAGNSPNNFARLFCFGFLILLFSQFIINIGMNLGLMPVTGITLPFLSYGGSSLISVFIALGIIQSISIRNFKIAKNEIIL